MVWRGGDVLSYPTEMKLLIVGPYSPISGDFRRVNCQHRQHCTLLGLPHSQTITDSNYHTHISYEKLFTMQPDGLPRGGGLSRYDLSYWRGGGAHRPPSTAFPTYPHALHIGILFPYLFVSIRSIHTIYNVLFIQTHTRILQSLILHLIAIAFADISF